jgi:hypothetical protein
MQSQGIVLASNPTSWATTFVALTGLSKLPLPKTTLTTIDFSSLDSPNDWEEFELSLLRRGDELEFEYNVTSLRIDAIETILLTRAVNYYKVTIPGFTKFFWFTGVMTAHDPGEGAVDAKVVGKFKIKTTGRILFQTATPT